MDIKKKHPLPSPAQEDIEQALVGLWAYFEQDKQHRDILVPLLDEQVRPGILEELLGDGFIAELKGVLDFTDKGRELARSVLRRHRLTERLFKDVLDLSDDKIDSDACRMEHVMSEDVEEAVCTLLGHPLACPHELPIPRGRCCDRQAVHVEAVMAPLAQMQSGQVGTIAYLAMGSRPELHKLFSLGVVPGAVIRINQTSPAYVVSVGNTMIALDKDLAAAIFVRKNKGRG
ncbi:MAG: metal-dependent transcriptional regulator [Elusimicrobiota bacterium]